MRKYEKLVAVTLLLVMLFNIVDVKTVEADINTNLMKAYMIFAMILNAYSIHTTIHSAAVLADNYFRGNSITADDFVTQGKNFISNGIINVGQLGVGLWGINAWIKNQFKKGFNNKTIDLEDAVIIDNGDLNTNRSFINCVINKKYVIKAYGYDCFVIVKKIESAWNGRYFIIDYNLNGEKSGKNHRIPNSLANEIGIRKNGDKIEIALRSGTFVYMSVIREIGGINENPITIESENINYYAGQAVDYPNDEYPEEKPLSLPVPNFESEKFRYDDAGNKVYDGTIDDFLNDAFNNQVDYYDKSMDYLIGQTGTGTKVNVNSGAGTITWDNAGTQTWPETGIDIPDLTYPADVGEAVNEQTGVITSIADWLVNVFAEPTATLDFGPISTIQISDKFPFCLPYDLSRLIIGLSEKSEVPNIELNFEVLNDEYTIPLNFEIFSDWAIIVNWFILIIFIVGLIMISRRLIGG